MNKLLKEFLSYIVEAGKPPRKPGESEKYPGYFKMPGFNLYADSPGATKATHKVDKASGQLVPVAGAEVPGKGGTAAAEKGQDTAPVKGRKAPQEPAQQITGTPDQVLDNPNATQADVKKSYAEDPRRSSVVGFVSGRGQTSRLAALDRARELADREDSGMDDAQREAARGLHEDTEKLLTLKTKLEGAKTERERKAIRAEMAALAQSMKEKYGLLSNADGNSFKSIAVGSTHRHIFGHQNALAKQLVEIFRDDCGIDLRAEAGKDPDKKTKIQLQKNSKVTYPEQDVARADSDDTTRAVMSGIPARVAPRDRAVVGPKGPDGKLISRRPPTPPMTEAQADRAWARHSATTPALTQTSEQLRAAGLDSMADEVDAHQSRVNAMLDDDSLWPDPDTQEARATREKMVRDSYKEMVLKLHKTNKEMASSMLKNLAELSFYQEELVAGKEVYLPASGAFPVGDKLRRSGGGTTAERITSISVKYDKSGNVYGFPAQSSGYMAYDTSEGGFYGGDCVEAPKRQVSEAKKKSSKPKVEKAPCRGPLTSGTPGSDGYALGVRDDVIDDDTAFERVMVDSGMGEILSPEEQTEVRDISRRAADCVRAARGKRKSHEAFKACQQEHGAEMRQVLYGDPEDATKVSRFSNVNESVARTLRSNPLSFVAVAGTMGAIRANNGFADSTEHYHQAVTGGAGAETEFDQECEKASGNLRCWDLTFRGTDERGGGVRMAFNSELCDDEPIPCGG